MQSAARIAVSMILLSSALATAFHNSAKLRRDGILNLYPFPRVGRSHHTWQEPFNDLLLGKHLTKIKRQLYAFPRVGRSDLSLLSGSIRPDLVRPDLQALPARRSESSPSMWFGPRLGRTFKNDEDDITIQHENDRSEPEQLELPESEKRHIKSLELL